MPVLFKTAFSKGGVIQGILSDHPALNRLRTEGAQESEDCVSAGTCLPKAQGDLQSKLNVVNSAFKGFNISKKEESVYRTTSDHLESCLCNLHVRHDQARCSPMAQAAALLVSCKLLVSQRDYVVLITHVGQVQIVPQKDMILHGQCIHQWSLKMPV